MLVKGVVSGREVLRNHLPERACMQGVTFLHQTLCSLVFQLFCSHNLEEPQPPLSHRHTSRYCLSFNYLTLLIFFKYFFYFVFVEAFSIHTRIKMCFRCCWFNADVICSPGKELRGVERIHLLCLALPA